MGFLPPPSTMRNGSKCEPQHALIHRHVWHLPAHMEGLQQQIICSRFDSAPAGSSRGQHCFPRPLRARQISASSRAVGLGRYQTKLHAAAELYLQIKTPTSPKTKKELPMKEPQITIAFRVPAWVVQEIDNQRDSWNKSRPDKKRWSRSDMYRWILTMHAEHLTGERP